MHNTALTFGLRNPRRWLSVTLASALVVLAAAPLPAAAFNRPASISGTVTDGGVPVAGACVRLIDEFFLGAMHGRACTGADGRYQITGQFGDTVGRISVQAAGYPEYFYPQRPNLGGAERIRVSSNTPQVRDIALTRDFGTIAGRITWSDGTPAYRLRVEAVPVTDPSFTMYAMQTRVDGSYEISWLPPGDYRISLNTTQQWVPGKPTPDQATPFTVTAGGTVTVDDTMSPSYAPPVAGPVGSISGVVTDRVTGAPLAGACIQAVDLTYSTQGMSRARTCTAADGRYTLTGLPASAGFRLVAQAPEHITLWAGDSPSFYGAPVRTVTAGLDTAADFALRRDGGVLQGQILNPGGDSEGSRWIVTASAIGYPWTAKVATNVGGFYAFEGLPPGAYQLSFAASGRTTHWWPGTIDAAAAGSVAVTNGATTVADATVLQATLTVRLVEQGTGAPATHACVRVAGQDLCGSPDGVYTLSVPVGTHQISVPQTPYYFDHAGESVTVSNGETVERTVTLRRGGTIKTTIDSSVTPGTTPKVCAYIVPVRFASDGIGFPKNYCNTAGAPREFVIGPLSLDEPVQLFVQGDGAGHGSQWLGTQGGTGQRATAAVLTLMPGKDVVAPPIMLDRAVRSDVQLYDIHDGTRLSGCVAPYGAVGGLVALGTSEPLMNCFPSPSPVVWGLGPYLWDLQVSSPGYATTWHTFASNRAAGTPLQVGNNSTAEMRLRRGATLSGSVQVAEGWQLNDVTVFDAVTSDVIAQAYLGDGTGPSFSFDTLNSGKIFLRARATSGAVCWFRPPASLGSSISVTTGQQITGLRVALGPGCESTAPAPLLRSPLSTGSALPYTDLRPLQR